MKSQNTEILGHLQRGKSITPLVALQNYGCMRLASRIRELREQGHNINSVMIDVGEKRVACYSLVSE